MTVAQKTYPQNQAFVLNVANDIVEMHKAKVTGYDDERLDFSVEMYGQITNYRFRVTKLPEGGSLVEVSSSTEGQSGDKQVSLIFAMFDNILSPFSEKL